MAAPFSQLPAILKRFEERIPVRVRGIVKQAAREAGRTAVRTTRVDTGAARSNWIASLLQPVAHTIPPYAPGNKLGIGERANASRAEAQHMSVIQQYKQGSIFITNNINYISILNDGGPRVPPGNMAALARLAGIAAIREERVLERGGSVRGLRLNRSS